MRHAELGRVPRPQRPEVGVQADLAASVHFLRLAVEVGQRKLGRYVWVCGGQLEVEIELVTQQLMHVPHLARPVRAVCIGLDREPLVPRLFVDLLVLRRRACKGCGGRSSRLPGREHWQA